MFADGEEKYQVASRAMGRGILPAGVGSNNQRPFMKQSVLFDGKPLHFHPPIEVRISAERFFPAASDGL